MRMSHGDSVAGACMIELVHRISAMHPALVVNVGGFSHWTTAPADQPSRSSRSQHSRAAAGPMIAPCPKARVLVKNHNLSASITPATPQNTMNEKLCAEFFCARPQTALVGSARSRLCRSRERVHLCWNQKGGPKKKQPLTDLKPKPRVHRIATVK
jgi:hypothetical protein